MRAVAMAKDVAFRRGHLPIHDDGRRGRASLICVHCGSCAVWERGEYRGVLVSEVGKCIGFEPRSRREIEIEEMDREDGWTGRTAIEEANWAARAARRMHDSLPRSGR